MRDTDDNKSTEDTFGTKCRNQKLDSNCVCVCATGTEAKSKHCGPVRWLTTHLVQLSFAVLCACLHFTDDVTTAQTQNASAKVKCMSLMAV